MFYCYTILSSHPALLWHKQKKKHHHCST